MAHYGRGAESNSGQNFGGDGNPFLGSDPGYPYYGAIAQSSDPMEMPPIQSSAGGSLDLSSYHSMLQSGVVDRLSMDTLTKSHHDQSWVGQRNLGPQLTLPFSPPSNAYPKSGAASDPMPHIPSFGLPSNGSTSEVWDSGYSSNFRFGYSSSTPLNPHSFKRQKVEDDASSRLSADFSASSPGPRADQTAVSDTTILMSSKGKSKGKSKALQPPCTKCNIVPKNSSDAKKHKLKHTKPYYCDVSGCTRQKGFSTPNDCERHKKSVHNRCPSVGSKDGYVCDACPVTESTGKSKFWPRRDNFVAHVRRMHPQMDETKLIEESKRTMEPDDSTLEVHSAISGPSNYNYSEAEPNEDYQVSISNSTNRLQPSQNGVEHDDHDPMWSTWSADFSTVEHSLNGIGQGSTSWPTTHETLGIGYDAPYSNGVECKPFPETQIVGDDSYYRHHQSKSQASKRPHPENLSYLAVPDQTSSWIPTAPNSPQSAMHSSTPSGTFTCHFCGKVKARDCVLKKHIKRHTRPYGCTFPRCQKRFGSRNDWKRHERSQHHLSESWKCQRLRLDGMPCCLRPFPSPLALKEHLRGDCHGMTDERDIASECERFKLGAEGHEAFWCGFCVTSIQQRPNTHDAWEARCQHIGSHFDKDPKTIDDWWCVDENKIKAEIGPQDRKAAKLHAQSSGRADADDFAYYFPEMILQTFSLEPNDPEPQPSPSNIGLGLLGPNPRFVLDGQ